MVIRTALIDGLDFTFFKPIINQVRDDAKKYFFKDPDIFDQDGVIYGKEGSTFGDYIYDNTLGGPTLLTTYEIHEDEDLRLGLSMRQQRNYPIIADSSTGLIAMPIYRFMKIEVKFSYIGQSKVKVQRMVNRLQSFYNAGGYSLSHNLEYSYLLPGSLVNLIGNIARLKEVSFEDFIKTASNLEFDNAIKRGSDYKVPAFRGVYENIFGYIEENPSELVIEKNSDTSYTMEFSYHLTVKEPYALSIKYPILVNNKRIDDKWLPNEKIAVMTNKDKVELMDINKVIKEYNNVVPPGAIAHKVPDYDNFFPVEYINNTSKFGLISILLEVDENNPKFLFSLDNLRYIGVPDYMIEYCKTTNDRELFSPGKAALIFDLFEIDNIKNHGLHLEGYNVIADVPLSIDKTYHIVISVILDKGLIDYYIAGSENEELINRDEVLYSNIGLRTFKSQRIAVKLS